MPAIAGRASAYIRCRGVRACLLAKHQLQQTYHVQAYMQRKHLLTKALADSSSNNSCLYTRTRTDKLLQRCNI